VRVVHTMPGAYNTFAVQDYGPSVKLGAAAPRERLNSV
jgi:hypothetical protein